MSRLRKRSRKQGTYFLYDPILKRWVGSVSRMCAPGLRYVYSFGKAMHFRNFARANRFRKQSEEVRKLVWSWWIFSKTKKVESRDD